MKAGLTSARKTGVPETAKSISNVTKNEASHLGFDDDRIKRKAHNRV